MDSATVRLRVDAIRDPLARYMASQLRLDIGDARATVDHLVRTEQSGKDCHGVIRILYTTQSGKFGPYDDRKAPGPKSLGDGRLHVDGIHHFGYPIMHWLTEAGCAVARERGVCVATGVGVYPSGALGDWARLACDHGCALILMGGSPPRVAAPDGAVPLLGTNPICVGIPTTPYYFICDCATSAITHGDLLIARNNGAPLPADSAVNSAGKRTVAADEVDPGGSGGALLTVGGSHKTFALSMAVELLTCLGGGIPGSPKLDEHGVFAVFLGPGIVAAALPNLSEALEGFQAARSRIPGWVSQQKALLSAKDGVVEVAAETWKKIAALID